MKVKLYQDGGAMAAPQGGGDPSQGGAPGAEQGAPAGAEQGQEGQGGQDPLMQIAQMFAQALQSQDCKGLAQGAQMFLQLIAQAQQGAQGGPEGGQPAEPTVMRKGGKFVFKKKEVAKGGPQKMDKEPAGKVDMSSKGGKAKK